MWLLPDFAALVFKAGAGESCGLLILVAGQQNQTIAAFGQRLHRMVFIVRQIIGCMTAHSNLKCTTRLVLRAIIEHNAGLAN
jgi:hypothetical protein